MLSQSEIDFYVEKGFLTVEGVFPTDLLTKMNSVLDGFIEQSRGYSKSNDFLDLAPDHEATKPKVRRLKDPHLRHDVFDQALRHERLLSILRCLLGPAIRFDHSKLNIKPIGGSGVVEWHQDWAFYPYSNDDLLAVGVYLQDCGPEDGPLLVIPGSHRGPILNHHHDGTFVGACDPRDLEDLIAKAVPLTGKAGSITLHHVRTLPG